jgi:hypothetical protein
MAGYPPLYGFAVEYRSDRPVDAELDEYLRDEFVNQHPGWQPNVGKADWVDPATETSNYMYLITGDVPDAESQEHAESKVAQLRDEIARELKALRPEIGKVLPEPIIKVWRWHHKPR